MRRASVGGLPPDAASLQLAGLVALADELGVALEATQLAQLWQFVELLLRWNRVHNLTAIDSPEQALSHHLLDSLAIVPTLRTLAHDAQARVLDVGSGGGLPGLPLAIAVPSFDVTVIDRVQKKVAFLQQVKAELHLTNVQVVHSRVEDYRAAAFDLIVARAFSSLVRFVRLTRHLLASGGRWCAMKGAMPHNEITELERSGLGVRAASVVKLHVPRLDAERHLVVMEPS